MQNFSDTSARGVVFPTITVLLYVVFQWFLFSMAIVTSCPPNLATLNNAGPMTCLLVANFRAFLLFQGSKNNASHTSASQHESKNEHLVLYPISCLWLLSDFHKSMHVIYMVLITDSKSNSP